MPPCIIRVRIFYAKELVMKNWVFAGVLSLIVLQSARAGTVSMTCQSLLRDQAHITFKPDFTQAVVHFRDYEKKISNGKEAILFDLDKRSVRKTVHQAVYYSNHEDYGLEIFIPKAALTTQNIQFPVSFVALDAEAGMEDRISFVCTISQ